VTVGGRPATEPRGAGLTAKYPGLCVDCGEAFAAGERITYLPPSGEVPARTTHVQCRERPKGRGQNLAPRRDAEDLFTERTCARCKHEWMVAQGVPGPSASRLPLPSLRRESGLSMHAIRSVLAQEDAGLKGSRKHVLTVMAFHANHETGKCKLRFDTLEQECGLKSTALSDALKWLQGKQDTRWGRPERAYMTASRYGGVFACARTFEVIAIVYWR
jgi:hypothetical protein